MLDTLANLKSYMGIASDDTTYDTEITYIGNAVSQQFDTYTNRILEAADYSLEIDGNGLDHLYLPHYPINEITSIHIDTDRVFGDSSLVDSSNYVYYNDGLIALTSTSIWWGRFPAERQCVKVVCNLGYIASGDDFNLPYDLQKAFRDQVKYLYQKWLKNEEGKTSYSTIGNSVSLVENTDILKISKATLDKYVSRYHGSL